MSTLDAPEFDFVRTLVRTDSAIVLEAGKEYLVESRLAPIARAGLARPSATSSSSSCPGRSRRCVAQVVDAMTTNETSFFRDVHPWQTLREHILPDLFRRRGVPAG